MSPAWFKRAPAPPAEAQALAGGQRLLAWAEAQDGGLLVATPAGLWWPPMRGCDAELLPWWRIDKATWQDGRLTVVVADADEQLLIDRPPQTANLGLAPNPLPSVVRKRVEGSIRRTERVRLPAGSVRVVARTVAGQDGLTWRARLEPGTVDSPALRAQLSELLQTLAEQSDAALRA